MTPETDLSPDERARLRELCSKATKDYRDGFSSCVSIARFLCAALGEGLATAALDRIEALEKECERLRVNLDNFAAMLYRQTKTPGRYTAQEVQEATLRWRGPAKILRETEEST